MTKFSTRCFLLAASIFYLSSSTSSFAMDSVDDERPREHFGPITLQVMKDPVVAADGHSYERDAIVEWFSKGNTRSPITGLPLKNRDLFGNQVLKTMINEWKPGGQRAPSVLEHKKADCIVQRVKEEFSKNPALLNSAKGQHIVAFLGNLGAGKSTLINLLAGKNIIVSPDEEGYVLASPTDPTAMAIGTGGNAETLSPKSIDVHGLRFFDLPSFNDTDGSERNLVNAAFTRKILLDAASVRLVFVVGQDQFTADKGASVKQMFHAIKTLFVVDQDISLVDDGVCVATKVTCGEQTDMPEFLSGRTNSTDNAELNAQLKSWRQANRLYSMFHPVRERNNIDVRDQILERIKDMRATKIHGVNVSVLYPPDTKGPLERMFLSALEGAFERKTNIPHTTLSDYDRAIDFYTSQDFWKMFDADVCEHEEAIGLLKEFCTNPYTAAFRKIEKDNEKKRQAHIQGLRDKRQKRVEDIEKRTDTSTKWVIKTLVPQKERDDFVSFDFAYHKDFYDQVCGPNFIKKLAIDIPEQDIVRRYYAGFISQHSHGQMMNWFQKFSGINALALVQQDIKDMKQQLGDLLLLQSDLAQETQDRKAESSILSANLVQETQDRKTEGSKLEANLVKEKQKRKAEGSILRANLAQETQDRKAENSILGANLVQETQDRKAEDSILGDKHKKHYHTYLGCTHTTSPHHNSHVCSSHDSARPYPR